MKPEGGATPTATPKRAAANKRGSDDSGGGASPTPTPRKKARKPQRKATGAGDKDAEAQKEAAAED